MPSQDPCFITALSTELIYHILDFVPPESHLDLACTCKRIADCSSKVLKRHQEAYRKYRVASDISPTTVPTLLRSIFGRDDPILAWHVRSLEIWHDRTSWVDWKMLPFDQPLHEDDMDDDCLPWEWQDDELDEYLEDIEGQLDAILESVDDELRAKVREQFDDGLDGVLKMLLIAYCPRLRSVKFITQECNEKSTLSWLRKMIQGCILYGSHWPPGFSNIKNIAVGVESDTWMTQTRTDFGLDPANMSMQTFATLLRLPRLDSIYYKDLERPDHDDDAAYQSRTLVPKHSSTVKHIFLDNCGDMSRSFRCALFEAPITLETFALRAGNSADPIDDADMLIHGLCTGQAASLHTLILYGPYSYQTIHGYRCSAFRNEELEKAKNLKTVAMDIADVDLDCMYSCNGENSKWSEEEQRAFFMKWFCEKAFPDSIERLIFWGHVDHHMRASKGQFLDWLEDALIHVIESHRWKDEFDAGDQKQHDKLSTAHKPCYSDLKAVYLEEIERQYKTSRSDENRPNTHKVHFQKLIEVGKKARIDIHTLTNCAPLQHAHDFPMAPDKYDLVSGPWWERRDEIKDWTFDVYKGRRVPLGCGKCGKCEECLSVYIRELWTTAQ